MCIRFLVIGGLVVGLAKAATGGVVNGDFEAGTAGWTIGGGAGTITPGTFGFPASPSGGQMGGLISSWGGDWAAPLGSLSQTLTGLSGNLTLSGEIYAAAHAADSWRDVKVDVLWDGSIVASLARPADPIKWAQDFSWISFSVPVVATGNDTLRLDYTVHFAEWTWVAADNLQIVPEPSGLILLGLGLPLLLRLRRR